MACSLGLWLCGEGQQRGGGQLARDPEWVPTGRKRKLWEEAHPGAWIWVPRPLTTQVPPHSAALSLAAPEVPREPSAGARGPARAGGTA